MDWTEITLPDAPPTGDVEFDRWVGHVTKHLRNYLGGLILNDNIANDSGDPAAWDFTLTDLTTNGVAQTLDLNTGPRGSIVPVGAKAVWLYVRVVDDAANSSIIFNKNGNSNSFNRSLVRTQLDGIAVDADILVFCDTDRVIEYTATNITFSGGIDIAIKGWLM